MFIIKGISRIDMNKDNSCEYYFYQGLEDGNGSEEIMLKLIYSYLKYKYSNFNFSINSQCMLKTSDWSKEHLFDIQLNTLNGPIKKQIRIKGYPISRNKIKKIDKENKINATIIDNIYILSISSQNLKEKLFYCILGFKWRTNTVNFYRPIMYQSFVLTAPFSSCEFVRLEIKE